MVETMLPICIVLFFNKIIQQFIKNQSILLQSEVLSNEPQT